MSELHTYRITFAGVGVPTGIAEVKAFTSADAVAQWREVSMFGSRRVLAVEPLHEASKDQEPRKWTTIPVAGRLVTERDRALEEARRFERENVELHAAIFGHAFGSIAHDQAVAEARRLRAEAQTLKWERDHAIASATAATSASYRGPEDRIEALEAALLGMTTQRDRLQAQTEKRRDALNYIAAIVWPNTTPGGTHYALDDLVEAVRKMGVERDGLRQERDTATRAQAAEILRIAEERDALQKRIDAALEYRCAWTAPTPADAIKAMVAILEGREAKSAKP